MNHRKKNTLGKMVSKHGKANSLPILSKHQAHSRIQISQQGSFRRTSAIISDRLDTIYNSEILDIERFAESTDALIKLDEQPH